MEVMRAVAAFLCLAATVAVRAAAPPGPYGVCAHLPNEGDVREELTLVRSAGIGWVRADFTWSYFEPTEGAWRYTKYDSTVAIADSLGIGILPILDYDAAWGEQAWQYPDKWVRYVSNVVARYHTSLRYWEVWNEQNIGFWHDTSESREAHYAELLRVSWSAIKAIDPQLQVLLGGLAGVDLDYLDSLYSHGAAANFDILNVHPYRYPGSPEAVSGGRPPLVEQIEDLRQAMSRNGDTNKPLWFTEIGWPTHTASVGQTRWSTFVRTCLRSLDTARTGWLIAYLDDPSFPPCQAAPITDALLGAAAPGIGSSVERVMLDELPALVTRGYHALVMPPGESFPVDHYGDMISFVKAGGILVLSSGVPLYYALSRQPDGSWSTATADANYRRGLHLDFEAWWFTAAAPRYADSIAVVPPFADSVLPSGDTRELRYLSAASLGTGDSLQPVVVAYDSAYEAPLAAIYHLDSDSLSGAVVVTTQFYANNTGVTPERQAVMLARSYLISCSRAVDRVFWYEFRANEDDPSYNEDHFGIVHRDFSPKPAYTAYATLTRARPGGSTQLDTSSLAFPSVLVYRTHWVRPDGVHGWAFWSLESPRQWQLDCSGNADSAFGLYGNPVPLMRQDSSVVLTLGEEPVYLFGPAAVALQPVSTERAVPGTDIAQAPLKAQARRSELVVEWPSASDRTTALEVATLSGRVILRAEQRLTACGLGRFALPHRHLGASCLVVTLRADGRQESVVVRR